LRRFLIDTDTSSDDAVALVMALKDPEIRIEAITVVAGNVPLDQGSRMPSTPSNDAGSKFLCTKGRPNRS